MQASAPDMDRILTFLPSIEAMGSMAYWVIALGAFLESLAFVGLVVPGGLLVVLGGFLCARGVLSLGALFGFALAASMAGEAASFFAGRQAHRFLAPDSRVFRSTLYINARAFFDTFGPLSILAGRFLGPLRGVTPFVAGFSRMGRTRFFAWALVASASWSLAYPLLGFLFGNAWDRLNRWSALGGFVLGGAILVLAAWWVVRRFARGRLPALRDAAALFLGDVSRASGLARAASWADQRFPGAFAFLGARFSRDRYTGRALTLLTLALAVLACAFFLLARAVQSGATAHADLAVVRFLEAFRTPGLLAFFWRITLAGRAPMAVGIAAFATVWFLARGRRRFVLPLWAALLLTELSTALAKLHYARPRPPTSYYALNSLSFPSGHASSAAALYGFLALAFLAARKTGRAPAALLAVFAMLLMGASRLVLGVHYPGDVAGGYLIGLFWATAAIFLAQSPSWKSRLDPLGTPGVSPAPPPGTPRSSPAPPHRKWLPLAAILFAALALLAFAAWQDHVHPLPPPRPPAPSILPARDLSPETLARARLDQGVRFLGNDSPKPLNLLILAPETLSMELALARAGWTPTDPLTTKNLTRMIRASAQSLPYCSAPVLPAFWNLRAQDLAMAVQTKADPPLARHVIRLWNTGLTLDGRAAWAALAARQPCHGLSPLPDDDPDAERDHAAATLLRAFPAARARLMPLAPNAPLTAVIRLP